MRSILSELVRLERLVVVEGFTMEAPKTRELVARLQALQLSDVLIVMETADQNLALAARNLHWVGVSESRSVDPVSLVSFEKILITVPALRGLEERLG